MTHLVFQCKAMPSYTNGGVTPTRMAYLSEIDTIKTCPKKTLTKQTLDIVFLNHVLDDYLRSYPSQQYRVWRKVNLFGTRIS